MRDVGFVGGFIARVAVVGADFGEDGVVDVVAVREGDIVGCGGVAGGLWDGEGEGGCEGEEGEDGEEGVEEEEFHCCGGVVV